MSRDKPLAASGLEIHETDDGVVIYQESSDRVHHLNQTAAVILHLCDGSRAPDEIAAALGELFGLSDPPHGETLACLERLGGEGLVV